MSPTTQQQELKLAFYGDDFTGSTDALECLATAGVETRLFLQPPSRECLALYPNLQAIGVAGCARALAPDDLELEVRPVLTALHELAPRHVHYKVCSTFDSSPQVGSIGRVIDIAADVFEAPIVPLLVAAPHLGRWSAFGNLFARVGIGSDGEICRLDRHPVMRNHPSTPANESDLRLHLAKQTDRAIGLMDFLSLDLPNASLGSVTKTNSDIVLFDALTDQHLVTIGRLIDSYAEEHRPLFSVGSSGIESALTSHWRSQQQLRATPTWQPPADVGPILVVSGSCSPVTSQQICDATAAGFEELPIDFMSLFGNDGESAIDRLSEQAVQTLRRGKSVIVSSFDRTDARPERSRQNPPKSSAKNSARILGEALAKIALECVRHAGVRRLCIAGGDTSSYAAKALGIESLEMIAPLTPGAPLCRVSSEQSLIDGLEVTFKGGQVGKADFFQTVAALTHRGD